MKTTGKLIIFVFALIVMAASGYAADDSPLFEAVKKGDKAAVEALLAKGADVNAKDGYGDTPLHNAAYYGKKDIVELLLDKGADVNVKGSGGETPLQWAAAGGKKDIAELLRETMIIRAKNPRALLTEIGEQLKQFPDNDGTRGLAIALAHKIKPPPSIPEEAREFFVKASTIMQVSKEAEQLKLAINSLREALKLAPWWGDAYFNLGAAHELAGNFKQAKRNFELYLISINGEKEARNVQDRIYAIDAKSELYENGREKKFGTYLGGNWQLRVLDDRDMTAHTKSWRLNITGSDDIDQGKTKYQVRLENYQGCPRVDNVSEGGGIVSRVKFTIIDLSNCAGDRIAWVCTRDQGHYFNKVYVDNEALVCNGGGIGSIQGKEYFSVYELVP